jgi:hypothetical protein
MKPTDADLARMKGLSDSRYFLMLADLILKEVNREVLAGLISDYFYLRSMGMSNTDYVLFAATRTRIMKISIGAFFVFVQGLIFDREFRSVTIGTVVRTVSEHLA